jgi:hypothetical protein
MNDLNIDMNSLTAEIFKKDGRIKITRYNPNGEREVTKIDYTGGNKEVFAEMLAEEYPSSKGYRFEIYETYVTRKNMMNGKEFVERYDTPNYCSPASESYWSM